MKHTFITSLILASAVSSTIAANQKRYYLEPFLGLSQLSDTNSNSSGIGSVDGSSAITLDLGFNAGIGFGYRISDSFSLELAWEYRTNSSEVQLADGQGFNDGNYATNLFFINTIYNFAGFNAWQPYLGAGAIWVQEIDIDLEQDDTERSFSDSGDTGLQIFVGARYQFSPSWSVDMQIRYIGISGLALEDEATSNGTMGDLDYQPLTFQLGMQYGF